MRWALFRDHPAPSYALRQTGSISPGCGSGIPDTSGTGGFQACKLTTTVKDASGRHRMARSVRSFGSGSRMPRNRLPQGIRTRTSAMLVSESGKFSAAAHTKSRFGWPPWPETVRPCLTPSAWRPGLHRRRPQASRGVAVPKPRRVCHHRFLSPTKRRSGPRYDGLHRRRQVLQVAFLRRYAHSVSLGRLPMASCPTAIKG